MALLADVTTPVDDATGEAVLVLLFVGAAVTTPVVDALVDEGEAAPEVETGGAGAVAVLVEILVVPEMTAAVVIVVDEMAPAEEVLVVATGAAVESLVVVAAPVVAPLVVPVGARVVTVVPVGARAVVVDVAAEDVIGAPVVVGRVVVIIVVGRGVTVSLAHVPPDALRLQAGMKDVTLVALTCRGTGPWFLYSMMP